MRRAFTSSMLALFLVTGTLPAFAAERITLMVGGIDKVIYLPVKLAEQLGYFTAEGLDVELRSEWSGIHGVDVLLVGSVQGVVGFYDHTIYMQSKGKAVISVVQFAQAPGEVELVSTRMKGPVRTLADLKDSTLGVTGLGSSTQFLSRYLVLSAGLKLNQVAFVPVGTGDSFIDAMTKGAIQAGMTTEPTASRMINSGQARVLVDLRTPEDTARALGGPYPAACLYMQTAWVERHKPEVQKLVNALVKALRYIQTHTASEIAAQVPPSFYAGDKATYVKALARSKPIFIPDGRMPANGPAHVLKVLTRTEKSVQGKTIDLGSTYTLEFVNAVK
ncbi:MAG: ABC transporter substrate-binding protein [Geothrix sp.]|uniref:ABC transporter substrate-binding protein n=1 Tax=Geothrix sp. TaxID=1962974 RepID=UPI0017BA0A15|nr:ABC transporter substrate-binding protein [Geothrix sp.]NWJ41322.1 ABC transporter substrate-binding protein [Geothrix sp.]WIL20690.1 MAG: ABC transporter substrate-binding protein [Geothrix sp.]